MNKKKCPKCGEDNPPEAVMCWACYTPLSGESHAGDGSVRAGAVANTDEGKKPVAPWQMAVIGVALLSGIFVGVRTMMPSSSSDDEEEVATTESPAGGETTPGNPSPPSGQSSAPSMVSSGGGGSTVPGPQAAPYTVVVPPNPRLSVATMAIVPADGTQTGTQAAALASYTRRQFKGGGKQWRSLYIYVFADAKSAEYFAEYMRRRKGAALTASDYSYLSNLWGSVLTRYEYSNVNGRRVEKALYPSKNPNGWWNQA